jgi:hypothetical protein
MARGSDDQIGNATKRGTSYKSLLTREVRTADLRKEDLAQEDLQAQKEETTPFMAYENLMKILPEEEKEEESVLLEKRHERVKELFPSYSPDTPEWSALHYLAKRPGLLSGDYDVYLPRPYGDLFYSISFAGSEDEITKSYFGADNWETVPERIEKSRNDLIKGFEVRSKEALRLQKEAHRMLKEGGIDDFSPSSPAAKFLAQLGEEVVNGHPYKEYSYPLLREKVHSLESWQDSPLLAIMPEGYDVKIEEIKRGPGKIWRAMISQAGQDSVIVSDLSKEGVEEKAKEVIDKARKDAFGKLEDKQKRYLKRKTIFQGLETDYIYYDHYDNFCFDILSDWEMDDLKREEKGDYTLVTGTNSFYFPKLEKKKKSDLLLVFYKGRLVRQEGLNNYSDVSGSLSRLFPSLRRRNLAKIAMKETKIRRL